MEKEDKYPAAAMPPSFGELDYSATSNTHQQMIMMSAAAAAATTDGVSGGMVDYMINNPHHPAAPHSDHYGSSSQLMDRSFTSFADVMQFADFGPKLALHHHSQPYHGEHGDGAHAIVDPVYMLKFPVLNDHHHHHEPHDDEEDVNDDTDDQLHPSQHDGMIRYGDEDQLIMRATPDVLTASTQGMKAGHYYPDQCHQENNANEPVVQLEFLGAGGNLNQMMMLNIATSSDQALNHNNNNNKKSSSNNNNSKRKRARTVKTTEEVESQRMTHIAVERNRRKQMNEHLRVLRSLMPSSYVQRGDQASIIGGAIEFVRELEQLLQCLESQKRRRLYGEAAACGGGGGGGGGVVPLPLQNNQPFGPNNDHNNDNGDHPAMANKLVDLDNVMMIAPSTIPGAGLDGTLREESAENKSSIADVEVKLLGFDAFIKILSRRRPGQLIKAISALQDLQFTILHTNITTIEQTVLYSFNVKICGETRFNAEDIASSVQQIFTFIHANASM